MAFSLLRTVSTTFCSLRDQLLKATVASRLSLNGSFHSLTVPAGSANIVSRLSVSEETLGNCWSLTSVRTNIRNNFPRPREGKRLKLRYAKRMETRGGRAIIMRRYLKGKHILSH